MSTGRNKQGGGYRCTALSRATHLSISEKEKRPHTARAEAERERDHTCLSLEADRVFALFTKDLLILQVNLYPSVLNPQLNASAHGSICTDVDNG